MNYLGQAVAFLAAAVIAVPLFRRLGLGSVLGYLAAGIVLGPWALHITSGVKEVLNFSELGVVLLLFVIGLELEPRRLWVLRKPIFGLGSAQVLGCAIPLAAIAWALGIGFKAAVVIGLALSLSSTAFALQTLAERKELTARHGRTSFAILLFQDMAVIPLLFLVRALATGLPSGQSLLMQAAAVFVALGVITLGGRYLVNPLLRLVAGPQTEDVFTAAVLLVVLVAAALLNVVGLSMSMGAFLAGVLLADSQYRHALKANIEPFKGLLLGLFFMAVGMSVNLGLLASRPLQILAVVAGLVSVKFLVLYVLGRIDRLPKTAPNLAATLSQGGEFAFVLFTLAVNVGLLDQQLSDTLILAVTISMATTPPLMGLVHFLRSRLPDTGTSRPFDQPKLREGHVIIAGFGRFGQIVGRLLLIKHVPFTALEINPAHVDVVRRFGNPVYYGDASQPELLYAAKAQRARAFVLAIDDIETSMRTARVVSRHFPRLKIYACARSRRHAHLLRDLGVKVIVRESLGSSLELADSLLQGLGVSSADAHTAVAAFRRYDEEALKREHAFFRDEEKVIQSRREAADELRNLLESDQKSSDPTPDKDR